MTKRITHELLRHLDTLDLYVQLASGEVVEAKGDRPTRKARLVEAPAAAQNLKDVVAEAEGRVWLYASTNGLYATKEDLVGVRPTPNRAGEGLGYVVEELAKLGAYQLGQYDDPRIVLVSELAPMTRPKAEDVVINQIKKECKARGAKKPEIEAAVVAYCKAGQFVDPATENPQAVTSRYMRHIANVARHFDELQDGQSGVVLSMGHEPNLSFVLARVLGDKYAEIASQGAVKTGTGIRFVMEQTAPGELVQVRMRYNGLEAQMTL